MKRRKIVITNTSRWATGDLRKILVYAAKLVFDPGQKTLINVNVKRRTRKKWIGGTAYVGGHTMRLRLPDEIFDPRELAAVIVHEMGHLRGLEHRDMRGAARWTFVGTSREAWLEHHAWVSMFQLRPRPPVSKPERIVGIQLVEQRRQRAEAGLARWQMKAKRATNAIRKYRARIRYYQRRAAALKDN
jgi:hypothetical protein